MASKVYQRMWLATRDDIDDVLLREKVNQLLTQPVTEPPVAHRIFASLYARYVLIVNRLGDLYDQTLQVQKRALLRRILAMASQRLAELLLELKTIEMSEFVYVDQTLMEEKWSVDDVQLLTPLYYPLRRRPDLQAIVDGVRTNVEKPDKPDGDEPAGGAATEKVDGETGEAVAVEPVREKTTIQLLLEEQKRLADLEAARVDPWADAIRLLQIHEKARYAFASCVIAMAHQCGCIRL